MKLLLINPRLPESFWSMTWVVDEILPGRSTVNPPLGLATLAALCPDDWEITIVDENIESVPMAPEADLIGVCGMGVQFPRQKELLAYYRSQGYPIVAGGSFASLCPEQFAEIADWVIAGEAEYIWPQFSQDWLRGEAKPLYRETGNVDLADSPVPRFDLLKLHQYQAVSMQFSRGCPFRCEFCDIIVMFGRKPRTKSPQQVGLELDVLRKLGVRSVFFVDDNLIGNKPVAKQLLKFIAEYQREHDYAFTFGTEASLNLSQDKRLLELFRDANFGWVFIGIESPDEASLKETGKTQNMRQDILTSIRTIYAYGIDILAGFIVGFDNDTIETFETQRRFITNSGIMASMIGLLTALPRTPLYERLERAGRLIDGANSVDNVKLATNVMPKNMTLTELVDGYRTLHERLYHDRGIAARVRNKQKYFRKPVTHDDRGIGASLQLMRRLFMHGLLPGGLLRILRFSWSMPWLHPTRIPQAVKDWIIGLSMRDYVDRHFRLEQAERSIGRVQQARQALERALKRYRESVTVELKTAIAKTADGASQAGSQASSLAMQIAGWIDRRFYRRAARHLERLLRDTRATVTLHIGHLQKSEQARYVQRLLTRLSRYGDRVRITVDETVRDLLDVDSSIFHVAFVREV